MYGFMGFSYPLEAADCDDPSNSFAQISQDFGKMKAYGATMVRIYAPECRQASVWENIVKAGMANNMGVLPMVWWGFLPDQSLWRKSQADIYSLFTSSSLAKVAPYVVHSAAFGSEPIGDQVDGGPYTFVSDLVKFRKKMNRFGIPVAVSEDWDRNGPGYDMNSTSGNGLGAVGKLIQANTDLVHAHIMPYYHPLETETVSDAMPYTKQYLRWLHKYVKQPVFITETMWASTTDTGHGRGGAMYAVGMPQFQAYWRSFSRNCAMFKQKDTRAGWFMHTWSDVFEPGFGLIDDSGQSKIPNFKPPRC